MTEDRFKVYKVALAVCLVCSVAVSTAAVLLRPAQQQNALLDRQRNILLAAGLIAAKASAAEVKSQFSKVEARLVELDSGRFVSADTLQLSSAQDYDLQDLLDSSRWSESLTTKQDIAGIRRRERYQQIYLIRTPDGDIERLILPVRGYGLWSTLYGFIALRGDGNTITGLGFYRHGETPGLGGEVDNPRWKALWKNKRVYRTGRYGREPAIRVVKGAVDTNAAGAEHRVDGLSGASITTRGVDSMLRFWLGSQGFGNFLSRLKSGSISI